MRRRPHARRGARATRRPLDRGVDRHIPRLRRRGSTGTRPSRAADVIAGVAAAAAVAGVLVVAGATGDQATIRSPATSPTAAPTLATSTTEPTPTSRPHRADSHRAGTYGTAGHDAARDVDDRHVASGAAGHAANGAADGAGCRADDRDVRGDRRLDHGAPEWRHADARHRADTVVGLHGQRGRQRSRSGPCPFRARRPAHRDQRRPGGRSAGPEDRRELTQPRRATRRVIGMRVTSRSILAAGTISAAALIGAGITVVRRRRPRRVGPPATTRAINDRRQHHGPTVGSAVDIIDVDDAADGSRGHGYHYSDHHSDDKCDHAVDDRRRRSRSPTSPHPTCRPPTSPRRASRPPSTMVTATTTTTPGAVTVGTMATTTTLVPDTVATTTMTTQDRAAAMTTTTPVTVVATTTDASYYQPYGW